MTEQPSAPKLVRPGTIIPIGFSGFVEAESDEQYEKWLEEQANAQKAQDKEEGAKTKKGKG